MIAEQSWVATMQRKSREIQDGLMSMSAWANSFGASAEDRELLLAPFRETLESLYERDMPLARLADASDLLLHVRGPAASAPSPRVSVLARILTHTRDQVTKLAKQLAGVTTLRVPPSLDMGFVGVASGSLFIGFSADSAGEGELTRRAVQTVGNASLLVSENRSATELAHVIDDPAARDIAIGAVRHLSPSGQLGIREIDVLGKQVPRIVSLTTETRRLARGIMAQRVAPLSRVVTVIGTVRELDLDAARFEIRNVEGQAEDIRCAHELEEEDAKQLMDRRVRVRGNAEYGQKGTIRMLWIDEVEVLE